MGARRQVEVDSVGYQKPGADESGKSLHGWIPVGSQQAGPEHPQVGAVARGNGQSRGGLRRGIGAGWRNFGSGTHRFGGV